MCKISERAKRLGREIVVGCDVCGEYGFTMTVCQGCLNVMCESCEEECPFCEEEDE